MAENRWVEPRQKPGNELILLRDERYPESEDESSASIHCALAGNKIKFSMKGSWIAYVDQAKCLIHASVRLHAEMPLAAFPGLMRFRIT
jgi:hypothetical protein